MTKLDWENITNYIDSVGITDTIFPFVKVQSSVKVTASGARDNIIYTIGTQSGTLTPGQSVTVTGSISSMTLRAASGRQPFQVWATEAGTEMEQADTSYQGQIDSLETSLAEKAQQSDVTDLSHPLTDVDTRPILTFIDDDTTIETYQNWMKLATEKGIKISMATIPNMLGKPRGSSSYMTLDNLKEMYNAGHELLSHGWNSLPVNTYLGDETTIQQELSGTQQWLINNGFTRNNGYNYFVYPQGLGTTSVPQVKNTVKRFYKCGINVTDTTMPNDVIDSYNIARVTGDGKTSAYLKSELDQVIANSGWMIVLSHSYMMASFDNNDYNTWKQRFSDLIDYAKTNNVRIMTFGEAIQLRGNALSIGDFDNTESLYVSKTGKHNISTPVTFKRINDPALLDASIDTYPVNSETLLFCGFVVASAGNSAGTMRVVHGDLHFSYALFFPIDSNKIYKRKWDDYASPAVWTAWQDVSSSGGTSGLYKKVTTLADVDADISTYQQFSETIVECAVGVPGCGGNAGTMKVYRGTNHFSSATFVPAVGDSTTQNYKMYRREWNDYATPNAWGAWALVNS